VIPIGRAGSLPAGRRPPHGGDRQGACGQTQQTCRLEAEMLAERTVASYIEIMPNLFAVAVVPKAILRDIVERRGNHQPD
jgi:hypothetical protein